MIKIQKTIWFSVVFISMLTNELHSQTWSANGSEIYYNAGNVGVGTTDPADKLHVNGGKLRVSGGNDRMYLTVDDTNSKSIIGFGDDFGDRLDILFDYWNGTASDKEIMTLFSNGNVGIGTTSPTSKLHVDGQVRLNPGGLNNNFLQIQSNTSSQINMLFYSQNEAKWNVYTQDDGRFIFRKTGNNPDQGIKMVLDGDNVGIGTSSPNSALEVNGDIQLTQNGSQYVKTFGTLRLSADHDGSASGDVEFKTNGGGTKMIVRNDGKVGIGTTSPDSKLAVNGVIHSKEVKVDLSGWPDYVLEGDYNLPTLEEVEKHIREKGHLINIPSAKEVEENGIQLGEMNKLLLEKIEELTLYTLQQQQELEIQKVENTELRNRVEILEKYFKLKDNN